MVNEEESGGITPPAPQSITATADAADDCKSHKNGRDSNSCSPVRLPTRNLGGDQENVEEGAGERAENLNGSDQRNSPNDSSVNGTYQHKNNNDSNNNTSPSGENKSKAQKQEAPSESMKDKVDSQSEGKRASLEVHQHVETSSRKGEQPMEMEKKDDEMEQDDEEEVKPKSSLDTLTKSTSFASEFINNIRNSRNLLGNSHNELADEVLGKNKEVSVKDREKSQEVLNCLIIVNCTTTATLIEGLCG